MAQRKFDMRSNGETEHDVPSVSLSLSVVNCLLLSLDTMPYTRDIKSNLIRACQLSRNSFKHTHNV